MIPQLTRADVLGFRVRAQQLDRTAGTLADTAVLDLGVQDTGADAGRWALALRGVPEPRPGELALVWTLRGAPHLYRRADLAGVAAATAPFSDADAAKRIFDGARPLRAAGIPVLTALSVPHPAAMSQAMLHSDQVLRSSYVGFFQLPAVPEGVLLAGGGAVLRRMLRQGGLPADLVEEYVTRMRQPGALTAALNWYRALPVAARAPIGTVRVPTLHVWGAGDAFLGRAAIEASSEFVDAPYALEVLEDVNHWIPELAAERTGELVTAHVRTSP